MKKALLTVMLLMITVAGILFGCTADKYAGLKINFRSNSSDVVIVNNTVELTFGVETSISAKVTGMSGINTAVDFRVNDEDAIEITDVVNKNGGTTATFKALKPTYNNNYFIITAISIESSTKFKDLKVKVTVPVERLSFEGARLAVSVSSPLDLYSHIKFYPTSPITNQRDVEYEITDLNGNNPEHISINNGRVTVTEGASDWFKVKAKSTANSAVNEEIKITIVKDIDLSQIKITGPQVSVGTGGTNKTKIDLFSNVGNYNKEDLEILVNTAHKIRVIATATPNNMGDRILDVAMTGQNTSVSGSNQVSVTQNVTLTANTGNSGLSRVTFRIYIEDIDNVIFYDIDYTLNVNVSGLVKNIGLRQGTTDFLEGSTLTVFDSYNESQTSSIYGSKLVFSVSTGTFTPVDSLNRVVTVAMFDGKGGPNVSDRFEIYDSVARAYITVVDGYFTVNADRVVYIKALSDAMGDTYYMEVSSKISYFVTQNNGTAVNSDDFIKTNNYLIYATYGVSEITLADESSEKLIKYFNGTIAQNSDKYFLSFIVNEDADTSDMVVIVDASYINLVRISDTEYALLGIRKGSTSITIMSGNGFQRTIIYRIIDQTTGVAFSVDSPTNSMVISKIDTNANGSLQNITARAGGRFNVYSQPAPSSTGIISQVYKSSNESIATISAEGVISTKTNGVVTITITTTYYNFVVDLVTGFLTYKVEKFDDYVFDITIFIPSVSITLNRSTLAVYDGNSLGYAHQNLSMVDIYPIIAPANATISGDSSVVTYSLVGDNGNLIEVTKGRYQAFLNPGQTSATVIVLVQVREFGTTVTLTCTVYIQRAVQVQNITTNLTKPANDNLNSLYLSLRLGQSFDINAAINPTGVLVSDLRYHLFEADGNNNFSHALSGNTSDLLTVTQSNSTFRIQAKNEGSGGFIFLRIFALDSMTSVSSGKVFITIQIKITDGSLLTPYEVENIKELREIADAPHLHYVLSKNIDLSGSNWSPIANLSGTLNGYNPSIGEGGTLFRITGLTMQNISRTNVGLFANITKEDEATSTTTGALLNLYVSVALISSNNSSTQNIGALAGLNEGLIINCAVSITNMNITAGHLNMNIGGMVGVNKGTIVNYANNDRRYLNNVSLDLRATINTVDTQDSYDVATEFSFSDAIDSYGSGNFYEPGDIETMLKRCLSLNPINGRISVTDSASFNAYVGGIAGINATDGTISGIYGLYTSLEDKPADASVEPTYTFGVYESQGVDVLINITGASNNNNSAVGGVAGKLNGIIYNVSADGSIVAGNNVGGVFGIADADLSTKTEALANNVLSSVKITAKNYVGGIGGYVDGQNVSEGIGRIINGAYVENYEGYNKPNTPLITANNYVGGVVGYIYRASIYFAYAASFIKTADFYDIAVNSTSLKTYVGGVVGFMELSTISGCFARLKLDVASTQGYAGGIAGVMTSDCSLENAYFIGEIKNMPNIERGGIVAFIELADYIAPRSIDFVYSITTGNLPICNNVNDFWPNAGYVRFNEGSGFNLSFAARSEVWHTGEDGSCEICSDVQFNNGYPVFAFTRISRYPISLIKKVPDTLVITVKGAGAYHQFISPKIAVLKYSAFDSEVDGKSVNSVLNINQLVNASVSPSISLTQILVSSSNTGILNILSDGTIVLSGTGNVTLTFAARLNLSAKDTITVQIVPYVDNVKLYTDVNYDYYSSTDYLQSENTIQLRKNSTKQLYPILYDGSNVVNIKYESNYYEVTETGNITINSITNILSTTEAGDYQIELTLFDFNYPSINLFGSQKFLFNVNSYDGATGITVNPNNSVDVMAYAPIDISVSLATDRLTDGFYVEIWDATNTNKISVPKIAIEEKWEFGDTISKSSITLSISIKNIDEIITQDLTYTLRFIAMSNANITALLKVNIKRQPVTHMSSEHFPAEPLERNTDLPTAFAFSSESKNSIIPGKFGILVVDMLPKFASVERFDISSSVVGGNALLFSQLAYDSTKPDPSCYVYVPTKSTISNGIELHRYSNVVNASLANTLPARYNFDGKLYIQTIAPSGIVDETHFVITIRAYLYGESTPYYLYHDITIENIASVVLKSDKTLLSLAGNDYANLSVQTTGNINITNVSMAYEVRNTIGGTLTYREEDSIYVNERFLKLRRNGTEREGDVIEVIASFSMYVDGSLVKRETKTYINIVDVVISSATVDGLDNRNTLTFTTASRQQLRAQLEGFGSASALEKVQLDISRQLGGTSGAIQYWKISTGYGILSIDDSRLSLPFNVVKNYVVNSKGEIGAIVSLVGATQAGRSQLIFEFSYYYNSMGELTLIYDGKSAPEGVHIERFRLDFTAQVVIESDEDTPTPIYNEQELRAMNDGEDYILMEDIVIENHIPLTNNIASLDGNGKIIAIRSFAYDTNITGAAQNIINFGLFDTINQYVQVTVGNDTIQKEVIIKNLVVALPGDKNTPMNLTNYRNVNYGAIAAINRGIITNCDVITYMPDNAIDAPPEGGFGSQNIIDYSSAKSYGIYSHNSINYAVNIQTAAQIDGTIVNSRIGGFVGINDETGKITNSRVGREVLNKIIVLDSIGTQTTSNTMKNVSPVTVMRLEGAGALAGFVAENRGVISSSYFKNGQLINIGLDSVGSPNTQTAGFAAYNDGSIYGSFATGWEEENYCVLNNNDASDETLFWGKNLINGLTVYSSQLNEDRMLGGGIFANGNIAGFVFNNTGNVEDSYANMNLSGTVTFAAMREKVLSSNILNDFGNLTSGGFVYANYGGLIKTSYALSKLREQMITHGAFTGLNSMSEVLNSGTIEKCYYLTTANDIFYDSGEPATSIKKQQDTGDELEGDYLLELNEFTLKESFAGFSFDNDLYKEGMNAPGVWAMKKSPLTPGNSGYPELVSANYIAASLRVVKPTTGSGTEEGSYSYLYVQDYDRGSINNPYLISNAKQYNTLFNNILDTAVVIENITARFTGNIRIINNLDFTDLSPESRVFEYTSRRAGMSIFDGNNMVLSNIVLSDITPENTSFGFFKLLNNVGVKNLNLTINNVSSTNGTAVGGLAGVIVNSFINNINIVAAQENAEISGRNFVGGLAGIIVSGSDEVNNFVNNISANVEVIATYVDGGEVSTSVALKSGYVWLNLKPLSMIEGSGSTSNEIRLNDLRSNLSNAAYAGGVAGVIDLKQYVEEDISGKAEDLGLSVVNASSLIVGDTPLNNTVGNYFPNKAVNIQGQYAGGVVGFIGDETYLREAYFQLKQGSGNHYIYSDVASGGIAAINYGMIERAYASASRTEQKNLDDQIYNYTGGTTQINWSSLDLFTGHPRYIGGLVGINIESSILNTGNIKDCFSRLNVRNTNAIAVGGIVGATFGGYYKNVYTTGSLLGNTSNSQTMIGGIVGQIMKETENDYFVSMPATGNEVRFGSVVAANIWYSGDFAALKAFNESMAYYPGAEAIEKNRLSTTEETDISSLDDNRDNKTEKIKAEDGRARIGAIYGYSAENDEFNRGVCKMFDSMVFGLRHIYQNYTSASTGLEGTANRTRLFVGFNVNSSDKDKTMLKTIDAGPTVSHSAKYNELRELFNPSNGTMATEAKLRIFPVSSWDVRVWETLSDRSLPTLRFGYIPAIELIYTADEFYKFIGSTAAANKIYLIMNDLDFGKVEGSEITSIAATFKGTIVGQTQYKNEEDRLAKRNGRKPILFNVNLKNSGGSTNALFHNAIGATFSNFSIALAGFDDVYGPTSFEINTKSAVLVANAQNTNISRIDVYGVLPTGTNGPLKGFIRIAKTTGEKEYAHDIYGWDDVDGKYELGESPLEYSKLETLKTNAAVFGVIAANAYESTISNCNVLINVSNVIFYRNTPENIEMRMGGIAGTMTGSIKDSSFTGDISFNGGSYNGGNIKINGYLGKPSSVTIGGVVGALKGTATNLVYTSAATSTVELPTGISVGQISDNSDLDKPIICVEGNAVEANTAKLGNLFVGGVIGTADIPDGIFTQSGIINLVANDAKISIYAHADMSVGGIIGKNSVAASNLYYKAKNQANAAISIGTKTPRNPHAPREINVGGVVGINKKDRINSFTSSAKIEIIGNDDGSTGANKINMGGIVGFTEKSLIYDAIAHGSSLNVSSTNVKNSVLVGGIAGKCLTTTVANCLSNLDININDGQAHVIAGGAIGSCVENLILTNVVNFGDIKVNKLNAGGKALIGGLVGSLEGTFSDRTEGARRLGNATTARITFNGMGQKGTEYKVGQIIAEANKASTASFNNCFFSEALSVMYSNAYGTESYTQYENNIAKIGSNPASNKNSQSILGNIISNIILYKNVANDSLPGQANYLPSGIRALLAQVYNNTTAEHTRLSDFISAATVFTNENLTNLNYSIGININPHVISNVSSINSMVSGNYYVLTTASGTLDIGTNSLNPTNGGWHLNVNNILLTVDKEVGTSRNQKPIFTKIEQDAVVVGILVNDANITSGSATIATTNHGIIFQCGATGEISGTNLGGLVQTNSSTGRIISSFAKVIMKGSMEAGGLVHTNTGIIATSFSTSTIESSGTSIIGGIAAYNNKVSDDVGEIRDCYSDSNMRHANGSYIYPIASGTGTIYKSYYDENAYSGSTNTTNVNNATPKSTAELGFLNDKANGNWTTEEVSRELGYAAKLYKESSLFKPTEEILVENSWFNSGFGIVDFTNILQTPEIKKQLLLMLYTGNGKLEGGEPTNGFENRPYEITNIGVFELLVPKDGGGKSYYILMNNINAESYSLVDSGRYGYWSKTWDENGTTFGGDFNGNGYTIYNLKSKFGLFRIISGAAEIYDLTIEGFRTYNSADQGTKINSATGMLAAYMTSASDAAGIMHSPIIRDVIVDNCIIDNSAVSGLNVISWRHETNEIAIGHTAGSFVGWLANGTIKDCMLTRTIKVKADSFAGGVAGRVGSGALSEMLTDVTLTFKNDTFMDVGATLEVSARRAGGVVGSASFITLKNFNLSSAITVIGSKIQGGAIGEIKIDGDISNIISNVKLKETDAAKNTAISGGIVGLVGRANESANALEDITSSAAVKAIIVDVKNYSDISAMQAEALNIMGGRAGGIVGYMHFGTITRGYNYGNVSAYNTAGGIVGEMRDGTINVGVTDSTLSVSGKSINASSATKGRAGGIVGYMTGGSISGTNIYRLSNASNTSAPFAAGGIVGEATSRISNITLSYITNLGSFDALETGGIVGRAVKAASYSMTINYATNNASNASVSSSKAKSIGGIIGYSNGIMTLSNCSNSSSANIQTTEATSGETAAGGIIGYQIISTTIDGEVTKILNSSTNSSIISAKEYAGGIVGFAINIEITGSSVTGSTIKAGISGGIVGSAERAVISSATLTNTTVQGTSSAATFAGGIAGKFNSGRISDSSISNPGEANVIWGGTSGGIIGEAQGNIDIIQLQNLTVRVTGINYAGGVVAQAESGRLTIVAVVVGTGSVVSVTGTSSSSSAGGIVGVLKVQSTIMLTDSRANVSGAANSGGIVGDVAYTDNISELILESVRNFGSVDAKGSDSSAGGIIGKASGKWRPESGEIPARMNIHIYGVTTPTANPTANSGSIGMGANTPKYAGGIVGNGNGVTINSVSNTGSVKATTYAGGIAGYLKGIDGTRFSTITSSTSTTGIITAASGSAGGIAGEINIATVSSGTNSSKVMSEQYAGGIVGQISLTTTEVPEIKSSTNTGNIRGATASGGIVGYMIGGNISGVSTAPIINSGIIGYNADNTTYSKYTGGIVGYVNILSSLATVNIEWARSETAGKIAAGGNDSYAGGIVGYANATNAMGKLNIKDVTNASTYYDNNTPTYLGGIIGYAKGNSTNFNITISFATNNALLVTGTVNQTVGGIAGYADGTTFNSVAVQPASGIDYISITGYRVGGIVGQTNNSSITASKVGTTTNSHYDTYRGAIAGGLAGTVTGTVTLGKGNSVNRIQLFGINGASEDIAESIGGVFGNQIGGSVDNNIFVSTYYVQSFLNIGTTRQKSGYLGGVFGTLSVGISGTENILPLNVNIVFALGSSEYGLGSIGGLCGNYTGSDSLNGIVLSTSIIVDGNSHVARIGGIVGSTMLNTISLNNCRITHTGLTFKSGSAFYTGHEAGGFVGWAHNLNMSGCTNSSKIDIQITSASKPTPELRVGGLAGTVRIGATVTNCTNSGAILGRLSTAGTNLTYQYVGGFIGRLGEGDITNCVVNITGGENRGNVTAGNEGTAYFGIAHAGGVIGAAINFSGTINTTQIGTVKALTNLSSQASSNGWGFYVLGKNGSPPTGNEAYSGGIIGRVAGSGGGIKRINSNNVNAVVGGTTLRMYTEYKTGYAFPFGTYANFQKVNIYKYIGTWFGRVENYSGLLMNGSSTDLKAPNSNSVPTTVGNSYYNGKHEVIYNFDFGTISDDWFIMSLGDKLIDAGW